MNDKKNDKIVQVDVDLGDKRRRTIDEEDLGSQQSILKWMRHVPGPLQDVIKKRADQLEKSQVDHSHIANTNADRFSVTIATVFDQGPWVDMCQYLGMPAVSGNLYGSIKIRSLTHTVQGIVEDDEAIGMVPQLIVLIKSVHYVDEEILAVFHDPTGEVEGYFHREVVEHIGPVLAAGVGVLLHKVSIFTPTDAPVTGRRKSYLNITPRNIRQLFITKALSKDSTNEDLIKVFNKEKEIDFQQESDNDDYNLASPKSKDGARLLLQRTVRDTSAELAFLSQRQVIHRNPPVRADAAVATVVNKKGRQKKTAAASRTLDQENSCGLGKWQWSKLVQKTTNNNNDGSAMDSTCTQNRRGLLDASSRLVSLITQQNARHRSAVTDDKSSPTASVTAKSSSVSIRFAPGTVFDLPSVPRDSDICGVDECKENRIRSSQPCSMNQTVDAHSNVPTNSDDEDEDDDW